MTDPTSLELQQRNALIETYAAGYSEVVAALDGAGDVELDACFPGEWSARQVVHHLADSETTSYVRLRMLLAQEHAMIQAYDEEVFAMKLRYDRPIAASLAVLSAVRESSTELLRLLPEEDWQRQGTHSESGSYTMRTWLEIYAAHAHDHADQIRRARRGEK